VSLWVVVGGQYGSEGKGKVAAFITCREGIDICIRCGGPNSGHSFVADDGSTKVVRQLPTGFVSPGTTLMIPAGALIDLDVLHHEIEMLGLDRDRVRIDRNAMVIEPSDRERERQLGLRERLSSTLCGVGSAVARRALRGNDVRLASHVTGSYPWLSCYLDDVSAGANAAIDQGKKVLVEGTQGFGLSLYHTTEYPKATSRDTTAAGLLSEVGLSPCLVSEIVVVFRTFPIRVAGEQAGSLRAGEITWEQLRQESGCPHPICEFTTVTGKTRRLGNFDWELAADAIRVNRPTRLAVNGLDYLQYSDRTVLTPEALSSRSREFLKHLSDYGVAIEFLGIGPRPNDFLPFSVNPKALKQSLEQLPEVITA
jgi:adenylosuccinate synthase